MVYALKDLERYGLRQFSAKPKLIGGLKYKYLLILVFLAVVLFHLFHNMTKRNIFDSIQSSHCTLMLDKNPFTRGFNHAQAIKNIRKICDENGVNCQTFKPLIEACSSENIVQTPEIVLYLQKKIFGLSVLSGLLNNYGFASIATVIGYLLTIIKKPSQILGESDLEKVEDQFSSIKSSPKKLALDRIKGGTIGHWPQLGLRGGSDLVKHISVPSVKNTRLMANIFVCFLAILAVFVAVEGRFYGRYPAETRDITVRAEPTQMASPRTSYSRQYLSENTARPSPSLYPLPSHEPNFETVHRYLNLRELADIKMQQIYWTIEEWHALINPAARTLRNPSVIEVFQHSAAILANTAFIVTILNFLAIASTNPVVFEIIRRFTSLLLDLGQKYALPVLSFVLKLSYGFISKVGSVAHTKSVDSIEYVIISILHVMDFTTEKIENKEVSAKHLLDESKAEEFEESEAEEFKELQESPRSPRRDSPKRDSPRRDSPIKNDAAYMREMRSLYSPELYEELELFILRKKNLVF